MEVSQGQVSGRHNNMVVNKICMWCHSGVFLSLKEVVVARIGFDFCGVLRYSSELQKYICDVK
jgi:hypothetical protein